MPFQERANDSSDVAGLKNSALPEFDLFSMIGVDTSQRRLYRRGWRVAPLQQRKRYTDGAETLHHGTMILLLR